jgi:NAD(P) transhydrogenase
VDYFVQNTFNYPTLAEAYKIAGLDAFNRMPIPEEFKVRKKAAAAQPKAKAAPKAKDSTEDKAAK